MVTITNSKKWSGSGLLKSFSEKLGRWLFELRTWEQSQKLKSKKIFVFQFWCFLSVCSDKDKVLSGRTMAGLLNLCIFYFQMSHLQTSNKQYMTPTFSVDVSPAFYSKNKFSQKHCQILWSRQSWLKVANTFLREKKLKGVFTLNRQKSHLFFFSNGM